MYNSAPHTDACKQWTEQWLASIDPQDLHIHSMDRHSHPSGDMYSVCITLPMPDHLIPKDTPDGYPQVSVFIAEQYKQAWDIQYDWDDLWPIDQPSQAIRDTVYAAASASL